jgi:hypothetical protein
MTEIVKVQMPLAPPDAPILVYAKGKKNLRTIDQSQDLVSKLAGRPKGYFHATWTGKTWVIKDPAPDQPW